MVPPLHVCKERRALHGHRPYTPRRFPHDMIVITQLSVQRQRRAPSPGRRRTLIPARPTRGQDPIRKPRTYPMAIAQAMSAAMSTTRPRRDRMPRIREGAKRPGTGAAASLPTGRVVPGSAAFGGHGYAVGSVVIGRYREHEGCRAVRQSRACFAASIFEGRRVAWQACAPEGKSYRVAGSSVNPSHGQTDAPPSGRPRSAGGRVVDRPTPAISARRPFLSDRPTRR
jgi:hypothetical protein